MTARIRRCCTRAHRAGVWLTCAANSDPTSPYGRRREDIPWSDVVYSSAPVASRAGSPPASGAGSGQCSSASRPLWPLCTLLRSSHYPSTSQQCRLRVCALLPAAGLLIRPRQAAPSCPVLLMRQGPATTARFVSQSLYPVL